MKETLREHSDFSWGRVFKILGYLAIAGYIIKGCSDTKETIKKAPQDIDNAFGRGKIERQYKHASGRDL